MDHMGSACIGFFCFLGCFVFWETIKLFSRATVPVWAKCGNHTSFNVPLPSSIYNIAASTVSSAYLSTTWKCYDFSSTMKHNLESPIWGRLLYSPIFLLTVLFLSDVARFLIIVSFLFRLENLLLGIVLR